jgi:hypothetical protein
MYPPISYLRGAVGRSPGMEQEAARNRGFEYQNKKERAFSAIPDGILFSANP